MCRCVSAIALLVGVLAVSLTSVRGESLSGDVAALKAASIDTTGAGILAYFKKRTLSEEIRTKVEDLVTKLGDDQFVVREKATKDLIEIGDLSRGAVTRALRDPDAEIQRRSRRILVKIGYSSPDLQLYPAVARVLADRKPAGAAAALLNFLPNVEDMSIAEEVAKALPGMIKDKDGKVEKVVVDALKDRLAVKRFAAAEALAREGGDDHRAAVRALLKDADNGVRRRVAIALLEVKDKASVPALIALLETPGDDSSYAEDHLRVVAGEKAPTDDPGDTAASREKFRKAWAAWWKDNEEKVDLKKIDFSETGFNHVLVGSYGPNIKGKKVGALSSGAVMAIDSSGKTKWKIEVAYPVHASMVRRDRVLIVESHGSVVTERSTKGDILWTRNATNSFVSAERLRNGNTLLVMRNQILEIGKTGGDVVNITRPSYDIMAATKNRDGTFTMLNQSGQVMKLDKTGKATLLYNTNNYVSWTTGFRPVFLPNGGIVVPNYSPGRVREFDNTGKLVWEANMDLATAVARLPNGNILACSRLRPDLKEFDKKGKEVKSFTVEGRPTFIERK